MTTVERETIRSAIDQARRERLARPACEWCGLPIEPGRGGETRRFCCDAHRMYAWQSTPAGRAWNQRRLRRRKQRRRGQLAVA